MVFFYIKVEFILLQYVQNNKEADNDWFRLESDKTGTKWFGKCWYVHNLLKYEFDLEFDVSILKYISFKILFFSLMLYPSLRMFPYVLRMYGLVV